MEDFPNDIVGLVLLRLDSPVSLIRAASTCRRWRRIIAGDVFLRCFRSLHEPPVAGSYYNLLVSPRFEPSSSSPLINDSRYFSLDFLPKDTSCRWTIKDSQGSFLLMVRSYCYGTKLPCMVVCKPLTRSYEVIPPWTADFYYKQCFLLDGNCDADAATGAMISTSKFRVLCLAHGYDRQVHVGVFTAGSSSWRQRKFGDRVKMHFIGRAAGSLYWHCGGLTVTFLDQSAAAAEFSSFLLPNADGVRAEGLTVATGGDGEARIFFGGADGIIEVFASADGEWMLEKSVQLSPAMFAMKSLEENWYLGCGCDLGVHGRGKVMIVVEREQQNYVKKGTWTFIFDIDKLEAAERLQDTPYPVKLPWPPSLHACTELGMVACVKKGRKRRRNKARS